MAHANDEAQRPASRKQDETSSAKLVLKLRDGPLTVSVFSRKNGKQDAHVFAVPERAYRDKDQQWVSTHILHEEDLLRMGLLLTKAYALLRHRNDEPSSSRG